jgi:hypothetical protein
MARCIVWMDRQDRLRHVVCSTSQIRITELTDALFNENMYNGKIGLEPDWC